MCEPFENNDIFDFVLEDINSKPWQNEHLIEDCDIDALQFWTDSLLTTSDISPDVPIEQDVRSPLRKTRRSHRRSASDPIHCTSFGFPFSGTQTEAVSQDSELIEPPPMVYDESMSYTTITPIEAANAHQNLSQDQNLSSQDQIHDSTPSAHSIHDIANDTANATDPIQPTAECSTPKRAGKKHVRSSSDPMFLTGQWSHSLQSVPNPVNNVPFWLQVSYDQSPSNPMIQSQRGQKTILPSSQIAPRPLGIAYMPMMFIQRQKHETQRRTGTKGLYKCRKCGQPKKGHICPIVDSKVRARTDEYKLEEPASPHRDSMDMSGDPDLESEQSQNA